MGLTHFPHGVASFGVPVFGGLGRPRYGSIFYVKPTTGANFAQMQERLGTDSNRDGSLVFQTTLQAAIDLCQDDQGDLIVCGSGSQTVTTSVLFNKKGVTVIAEDQYGPYQGERFTIRSAAAFTDGPVATITRPTTIIGLGFFGRQTAATSVLASFGSGGFDSGGWTHLVRCWFPNHGSIARALDLTSVDRVTVEECIFDGSNNGALTAAGKRLTVGIALTQGHNVHLLRNEFINAITAIDAAVIAPETDPVHGNTGCRVMSNHFYGVADTHMFFNIEGVAAARPQKILMADNWLGLANTKTWGLNASLDSVANLTTEGVAFAGNHYAE